MKIKALVAGLALGVVAGSAFAAVDGSVATAVPPAQATSSGNLVVSLTVPNIVRISNLNDIALGTYAGVDMSGSDAVCVYRNITGNYRITADSTNGSGAFQLKNGASVIPYAVSWNGTAVTENTALTGLTGANTTSTTCGGGTNATVAVDVLATDIEAATVTGSHTDTLVLTLTSE